MGKTELLRKIYDQSLQAGADAFLSGFLQENLDAHFFPMFLKKKRAPEELQELSRYEFIKWRMRTQPGEALRPLLYLQKNPNLEILSFHGQLRALWLAEDLNEVLEMNLEKEDAVLLDSLSEDRKFDQTQLLEWVMAHFSAVASSPLVWRKSYERLSIAKIIF
jgi:hypothetical protein